jgi:tRNA splicing endonuclease
MEFFPYPKIRGLIDLGIGDEMEEGLILSSFDVIYASKLGIIEKREIVLTEKEQQLYNIYEYLMNRGYVCRVSVKDEHIFLRVFQKGYRRFQDRSVWVLFLFDPENIENQIKIASSFRKNLILAIPKKEPLFLAVVRHNFR